VRRWTSTDEFADVYQVPFKKGESEILLAADRFASSADVHVDHRGPPVPSGMKEVLRLLSGRERYKGIAAVVRCELDAKLLGVGVERIS
jgi:hypothetical protein